MPFALETIIAAPFLAAIVLLFVPAGALGMLRWVSALGAGVSLLTSVWVAAAYDLGTGGVQFQSTWPVIPSLGIALRLGVDGWGVSLLLLTGLIIFAGVFATWTLKDRVKEFYILLLVLVAGVFGVFVSLDLFMFFLFYEIAVLPMYLLIGIWGSSNKVADAGPFRFVWKLFDIGGKEYAAMKLTLMLLIGSVLVLVVMVAMYLEAGGTTFDMRVLQAAGYGTTFQHLAFPALWIGFGTLAGVWPFHTWSPDGHASAPTAVSMLHAGVLMKLGAFGVMRVGMLMLPEGARHWAWLVGGVAVLNILYGALSAMAQKDLKYIIAYSSVSHMGVVLLGAATLTLNGWNGALYQMFAHGLMTGLFFALVGLVYERAHSRYVPDMGGFATVMPGVAVFFTLAGLSSLGLPGLAGFVAEFLVFLGAWEGAAPWWALIGIIGAWVTAVYVLRAVRAIFWGDGPSERFHDLSDAKGPEWVALVVLGTALILFGVLPGLIVTSINDSTSAYLPDVVGTQMEALK